MKASPNMTKSPTCSLPYRFSNFDSLKVPFAALVIVIAFLINPMQLQAGTAPNILIMPPPTPVSLNAGQSQQFNAEATAGSGIKGIEWFIGSTSKKYTNYTGSWIYYQQDSFTNTFSTAGTYYVHAYVYDRETTQREAFVTWTVNVEPPSHPAKEFFDDFRYTGTTDSLFLNFGWVIQGPENVWGPGVSGTWRADRVSFVASIDLPGDSLLRMSGLTDGSTGGTEQADVGTSYRFRHGTFAVRARLADTPTGSTQDRLVEACLFLISPDASGEPYSECDFEYLPNGNWDGQNRPQLWVNSWETASPKVNSASSNPASYSGWHTFLIQSREARVDYYVDGVFFDLHSSAYAPDTDMRIAFQVWFVSLGALGSSRHFDMDIDWVWHGADVQLTASQVEYLISDFRDNGIPRKDTFDLVLGDINNDEIVDIEDAILALRVLVGFQPQEPINLLADVDGDGKIGMEEVLYILRETGGLIE